LFCYVFLLLLMIWSDVNVGSRSFLLWYCERKSWKLHISTLSIQKINFWKRGTSTGSQLSVKYSTYETVLCNFCKANPKITSEVYFCKRDTYWKLTSGEACDFQLHIEVEKWLSDVEEAVVLTSESEHPAIVGI